MPGSGTGTPTPVSAAVRSITKASIIAFCNKAWQESELAASTKFDLALQACLDDLSKLEILRETDETQALAVGDYAINYPTDYLPGGLIAITLTDEEGNEYEPLEPFPAGLREYRYCRDNDTANGQPAQFIAGDDDQWYVWRPANAAFDVRIEYYRMHPQDLTSILFPNTCFLAIKTGTVYWEAVLRRNTEYQNVWGPMYAREYQALEGMYPGQVRGVYHQ